MYSNDYCVHVVHDSSVNLHENIKNFNLFLRPGGHDRVFVSMVAAPLDIPWDTT